MAIDARLHDELLAMLAEHRDVGGRDDAAATFVATRHWARIWEILDDYEAWPGRSLVGPDGEGAAWLLVQDAITDPGLQRRGLELLEVAVALGDADPVHYALLLDRVRMSEGRPQLYGSQFVVGRGGTLEPWPMDDLAAVDERRRRLGLGSFAAHAAHMQERWREQGYPTPSTSTARQQYQAATER